MALPVPPAAHRTLQALPRRGLNAPYWTAPDDLHITLRFLGDIPATQEQAITDRLADIKRPAFTIEVAGLDTFHLRRQTILWAAVQSTRKLTALAATINETVEPLGFDMPVKPYIPHITLARLKPAPGLAAYISRYEKTVKTRWRADSFTLFRSGQPDKNDNCYKVLTTFPLQA